jgi:hypothetical protein
MSEGAKQTNDNKYRGKRGEDDKSRFRSFVYEQSDNNQS